MTRTNGKVECPTNNNNVVIKSDEMSSNGYKNMNGKVEKLEKNEENIASRKSLIILLSIFVASLVAMFYVYKRFPELEE